MNEEIEPTGPRQAKTAMTYEVREKPKVFIERTMYRHLKGWCNAAHSEVSGYFMVKYQEGNFHCYKAYLPKQKCSSAYTSLDDEGPGNAVDKLKYRLWKQGKNMEDFRGWWHTHYNFSVFWSGTDDDTATKLVEMVASGSELKEGWNLSIVLNQKGDFLARADIISRPYKDIDCKVHLTIDELEIKVVPDAVWHPRKRNFKSDIKRWIGPIIQEVVSTPIIGATDNWSNWQDYWKKNWGGGKWKYENGTWFQEGDEPKVQKREEPQKEEKQLNIINGKYIWHGGRLMEYDDFLKIKDCTCEHTGTWELCICDPQCNECLDKMVATGEL